MRIIYNSNFNTEKFTDEKTSVALGNFDGLHIGHINLIDKLPEKNKTSCIWTFPEHSANILKNNHDVQYITSKEDKIEILRRKNIDYLIFQDFNSVRNLSPEEFIEKIIAEYLNAEFVVCGYNYRFGKNGGGDAGFLRDGLEKKNIETLIIPPVLFDNHTVSSSYIRTLIKNGDMQRANKFLGRPFSINFPVVYGKQIGRKIGIPTINQIFPGGHIIPARGIYACTCAIENKVYRAVTNIGVRPTVNSTNNNLLNAETHLIDFSGDLYGKNIKIYFHIKLRDEIKFDSLDDLKLQIRKDIEAARGYDF